MTALRQATRLQIDGLVSAGSTWTGQAGDPQSEPPATGFAFDSVQLVNQGDLASDRANLETVAPPKLPELS